MMNDPRVPNSSLSRVVTNFDILTNPYKLTPYRSGVDGSAGAAAEEARRFTLTGSRLFKLGVVLGSGKAEVLYKNLTTGGSTDLDDSAWGTPANNASAAGATSFDLFSYYKKTGLIYGARAGTNIWAFDPTGSAGWADSHQSISYSTLAQGCTHPTDDVHYIPYNNKIAANDNGAWNLTALTLPSYLYITSICAYRNFLAIACAPTDANGNSVVFLWNRDTSLTVLSETIDWGEGIIKVLEELGGDLVGISYSGNSSTRFNSRVIFRYYTGYGAEKIAEFVGGTSSVTLPIAKQRINNRLHFMMQISLNGSVREGVFSVGRSPGQPYSIIHERSANNDTALVTSSNLFDFIYVGDFLFQAYLTNSVYGMSKTDSSANYTASAVYETEINEGMDAEDRKEIKQLTSVGALYERLPASGQVVVQYRVDGGSWITIFTETTDSVTYTEPKVRAANGSEFSKGKDYEFRITSTGGAEVVGVTYKYGVIESNV